MVNAVNSDVIPNVKSYGFTKGASSPMQSAFISIQNSQATQNKLNNQHGGKDRIIVPQAPTYGMPEAGPNNGNSSATVGAGHLSQQNEYSKYDHTVGQPGTVTTVAGGGRNYKKRKSNKNKKSKKSKSKKSKSKKSKKFKKSRKNKSRKNKSKKNKSRKNKTNLKTKKGGYKYQQWGCFS